MVLLFGVLSLSLLTHYNTFYNTILLRKPAFLKTANTFDNPSGPLLEGIWTHLHFGRDERLPKSLDIQLFSSLKTYMLSLPLSLCLITLLTRLLPPSSLLPPPFPSFICHSFLISPSLYPKSLFFLSSPFLSTLSSLSCIESLKCRNPVSALHPPLSPLFLPLLSQTVSSRNLAPDSCRCFLWYQRGAKRCVIESERVPEHFNINNPFLC